IVKLQEPPGLAGGSRQGFGNRQKLFSMGLFYLNSDSSRITNLAILILFLQEKKVTKRTKKRI
ncbi:hypothetical protein, partial [Bilophila wadsworthia]|uniref:hypothetical protein n=1 Tax=Bilophila wadsworthia TaxID=35833 RepID=UPI0026661EEC